MADYSQTSNWLRSKWLKPENFKFGHEHDFNLVWLLIIAVSLIFVGLGWRDPWPADEPRFAQIAREMVETGQWFFPMRGGELYPDKPPVFMWTIALFYSLTGSIKISFLLPSAICSVVSVMCVYDLGRRMWNPQTGWYAGLLLLLTIQFTLQAKTAQIDAMVCCWITIGCYGMLRHLVIKPSWPWYFTGCIFMGLGVITKGVGFLPILMFIPYIAARFIFPQNNEIKGSWQWFMGLGFMLATIMIWFVPMLLLVDQSNDPMFIQYRDNILFKQTAERYAKSFGHIKPFWYFVLDVIPVFWLPVSLMFPWLAKHWSKAIKAGDRRIFIPLGWIVLLVLFFSISPGKRGVYVLPAVPMLSLITAPYLTEVLGKKMVGNIIWWFIAAVSSVLLLVGGLGMGGFEKIVSQVEKFEIDPWSFVLTLGGLGILSLWISRKRRWVSWLSFIPMIWVLYSTWGYQLGEPVRTPKGVFKEIARHIAPEAEIALVKFREQFLYFSRYKTTHFGYHTQEPIQQQAAWQWLAEKPNRYVLSHSKVAMDCFDNGKAISVGLAHGRNWLLFGPDSRLENCPEPESPAQRFVYAPGGAGSRGGS